MFLELIATVVFGIGAAGVVLIVRRFAPQLTPRWAMPAAAGMAMLGFTIWSEYAWFPRVEAALPSGMEVASTHADSSMIRPWTYALPYVSRVMALDLGRARRHPDSPGRLLVDVYLFQRHMPTARFPVLIDCVARRRAEIADGATFSADGQVEGVDWRVADADDPLIDAACPKDDDASARATPSLRAASGERLPPVAGGART